MQQPMVFNRSSQFIFLVNDIDIVGTIFETVAKQNSARGSEYFENKAFLLMTDSNISREIMSTLKLAQYSESVVKRD